jgi:hypothetical protein
VTRTDADVDVVVVVTGNPVIGSTDVVVTVFVNFNITTMWLTELSEVTSVAHDAPLLSRAFTWRTPPVITDFPPVTPDASHELIGA